MKNFNTWLTAEKNLDEAAIKELTAEKQAEYIAEYMNAIAQKLTDAEQNSISKDDLEKLTKEQNEALAELSNKNEQIQIEQGKAIKSLIERSVTSNKKKTLVAEIKENKEAIIKLFKQSPESGEILVKALTNRAAITDNEAAIDIPEITQLAHKKLSMYETLPKLTVGRGTHNGTVRYYDWDDATTVRAAAMVAEGAAFPESTAKWQKYSIDLKKIGDTLPVTEEFFEDEVSFSAELEMFLRINVDLVINQQLTTGDGTGNNMTGLYTSANTYTPVASGISDASIYDLAVKVSEDITTNYGSKYMPNVIYLNISDINKYRLKKDANENYILPPFVDANGRNIDGMQVIENNFMTANTMLLGDNRFARIYEMAGTEISRGHKGDQFVEDEITLKARRRMLLLVKNQDKLGFRKVTSISGALTTLAS